MDGRGDPEELVYFIPRATLLIFSLSLPFRARILGFVSTVDTEKREGGFIFIYVSLSLSVAPIQPTSSFLLFSI